jgi:hypothetical protein
VLALVYAHRGAIAANKAKRLVAKATGNSAEPVAALKIIEQNQ